MSLRGVLVALDDGRLNRLNALRDADACERSAWLARSASSQSAMDRVT